MVECRRRSESQKFSDKSSVEISFNFLLSQFLCVVCVNVPTQMFTHRNGDGESRKVSNACWLFYVCAVPVHVHLVLRVAFPPRMRGIY